MWLFSTSGFFSIVQKPEDVSTGMMTIRARVRSDLDTLRTDYLSELGPTQESIDSDYRYRARAPKASVIAAMANITEDIDYSNFKNAVASRQGPIRAKLYGKVWDVLYGLQSKR